MLFPLLAVLAQDPAQAPPPTVTIPRIDAAVTIDGVLDEPVWAKAARLDGFHQYRPVDGRMAEQETIVLVWYSPTAIHFGIIANDTDPGSIRATFTDRDKIDGEDRVRLYLDTFNDKRRAAFFGVNGLGVQEDGLRSETGASAGSLFGGQDDLNVDYLWDSKGRRTEQGYEVEVRVPFKSLQYAGAGPQSWGFNAVRYVQRTAYQDTWTDVRRANSSFLAQSGTLTGLEGMQRGLVFEAQPFVTAGWAGNRLDDGSFTRDDPEPSVGINLQLATTTMAFDGTINPDFSQVESDVGLITVNERFALFVPEKRPFFLKGIDLFSTPGNLIYTRRIADPYGGAKVTGKVGRNSIAYLGAVDDFKDADDAWFNLVRVRRDLGANSVAGLTYTDRVQGGAYNRLLEGDAHIVFAKLYFVEAQYGQSWTNLDDGAGTATDPIWKLAFDRTGRMWGFNYSHQRYRAGLHCRIRFRTAQQHRDRPHLQPPGVLRRRGRDVTDLHCLLRPDLDLRVRRVHQQQPCRGDTGRHLPIPVARWLAAERQARAQFHVVLPGGLRRPGDGTRRPLRPPVRARQPVLGPVLGHDAHVPAL